jgi:hypothetical protein
MAVPSGGSWNNSTFTIHQASRWYETGVVSRPSANVIRVTGVSPHTLAGSARVDYHAGMGTLVGANGLPVATFTGLPCPPVP